MTLTFNGSDLQVAQNLRARIARVMPQVAETMNAENISLQSYIQGSKLQGQVLQHRTGKLFNSVRADNAVIEGERVVGGVHGAGGVAWYGRLHEYGGIFTRRTAMSFGKIGTKKRMTAQRTMGTVYTLPERSFMRSAFVERRDAMLAAMRAAVVTAVRQA